MKVSDDQIKEELDKNINLQLEKQAKQSEALSLFYSTCEKEGQPDYELLRKHIEVWTQRHSNQMVEFFAYRTQKLKENENEFGSSGSLELRNLGAMPPGLYALLCILAPNFLGAKELTVEERVRKQRTFYKKFPIFSMCKKI